MVKLTFRNSILTLGLIFVQWIKHLMVPLCLGEKTVMSSQKWVIGIVVVNSIYNEASHGHLFALKRTVTSAQKWACGTLVVNVKYKTGILNHSIGTQNIYFIKASSKS